MKLQVFGRKADKKGEASALRREGKIPAILYGKGHDNQNIAVSEAEYLAALRQTPKGQLSTTVFKLTTEDGKVHEAIVKEVQYHVTSYRVIHLDFEELAKDVEVNVKVPIAFTGTADCVGVKMGGVIRQVIRHIRVRCLPADIPTSFTLDVEKLDIKQTKRLCDLAIPERVRPLADLNEVAVVIAKR